MATRRGHDEEDLLSEGLYRLVGSIIGYDPHVRLRRQCLGIVDWMHNNRGKDYHTTTSGSRAEGFEMKTSDLDMMYWPYNTVVVENESQSIACQPHFKTVLMTDYNYTSPGFALVKYNTRHGYNDVMGVCVQKCNEYWVSNVKYMEYHLKRNPSAVSHGPCQTIDVNGLEMDLAECLKCVFWPQKALPAISRMRRCGWPPEDVIQEIIKDGCLLVPVPSKRPLFEGASDLEWRISFSLAEKRLVHSMNHCQFLCYGLWKLFSSEVLKKLSGIEDLMCSYFFKTVVFWEISRDASSWTPTNFIPKFQQTLRLLISLVQSGICPNFFIPDNNMFYGKVCGERQRLLLSHLRSFENEGFLCLLRCPSLRKTLLRIIENPVLVRTSFIEEPVDPPTASLLIGFSRCDIPLGSIKQSAYELYKISTVNTDCEFFSRALCIRRRRLHQNIADRVVHLGMLSITENKVKLRNLKFAMNILRDNNSYLGHGELMFAKAFYALGDFRRSIRMATSTKINYRTKTRFIRGHCTTQILIDYRFRNTHFKTSLQRMWQTDSIFTMILHCMS